MHKSSEQLSVATINLNNLGTWSDPERIKNFVLSIGNHLKFPHIIAVQEIGGTSHSDGPVDAQATKDIIQQLRSLFDATYHYIDIPPLPNQTGGAEGINIRCGFFYHDSLSCIEIRPIEINHPAFTGNNDNFVASRYPIHAIFSLNGIAINIINCHLKSMNKKSQSKRSIKSQRIQQANLILEYYQNNSHLNELPTIIMGDFNDTPNSKPLTLFSPFFSSTHSLETCKIFTYKYHNKPMILDYILYNSRLLLHQSQILHINTNPNETSRFSDHDPILAIFSL